jgi:hypothetical protein
MPDDRPALPNGLPNLLPPGWRAFDRGMVLEDAAWAAHCWIVEAALSGRFQRMPPADISAAIGDAIKAAKPR